MLRPSWDDVWMEMACTIAKRSLCSRAQVGAVIVSADNMVQSAAYNGPAPGFRHYGKTCDHWCPRQKAEFRDPEYLDCESSHAEISALVRADRSRLDEATIYVSGAVCFNCAKSICHTGITSVHHIVHEADMHRHPEAVERYLWAYHRQVVRRTA